jgi:hypothetical protein
MSRKRTALLTTSAAFVIASSFAPAAMAAPSVASKMLSKKEVPSVFGTAKNYDFNATSPDKAIWPCSNASGVTLYSQPAPKNQPVVDIETKNGKTYTSVTEHVYEYPNAKDAATAYTSLYAGSKKCDGTTTAQNGTDTTSKITETWVTGSQPGAVYQNFYVMNQSNFQSAVRKYNDKTSSFTLYSQTGNVIIATTAYVNPQEKFTPAEITAVSQLGINLTAKWAK